MLIKIGKFEWKEKQLFEVIVVAKLSIMLETFRSAQRSCVDAQKAKKEMLLVDWNKTERKSR